MHKLLRAFPVLNIRLDRHNFTETLKPRISVLKLFGKINQRPHRIREHTDVEKKCHQVADIDAPARN